jgi:hypothetical protein
VQTRSEAVLGGGGEAFGGLEDGTRSGRLAVMRSISGCAKQVLASGVVVGALGIGAGWHGRARRGERYAQQPKQSRSCPVPAGCLWLMSRW